MICCILVRSRYPYHVWARRMRGWWLCLQVVFQQRLSGWWLTACRVTIRIRRTTILSLSLNNAVMSNDAYFVFKPQHHTSVYLYELWLYCLSVLLWNTIQFYYIDRRLAKNGAVPILSKYSRPSVASRLVWAHRRWFHSSSFDLL